MQHLTTTELKRELVIRESVAAFEKRFVLTLTSA